MKFAYWVIGDEYKRMALVSAASARKHHPDCQIDIIEQQPSDRPLMVANLDAQIEVLSTTPDGESVWFLDADTLVNHSMPVINGDIVVTWRDQVASGVEGVAKQMPYNYGVVGVIAGPRVLEAFIWLRARILQMSQPYQKWYGNQLALAQLACTRDQSGRTLRHIKWSHTDVGTAILVEYLPCDLYNYTPESDDEDVSEKYIIHAKGNRKHLLEKYAA